MVKVKQTIPRMEWCKIARAYVWISFDGQALTCKCCRVLHWQTTDEGYQAICRCGYVGFMRDYSREAI